MELVNVEIDLATLERLAADVENCSGYANDATQVMCISGMRSLEGAAELQEAALIRSSLQAFEEDWDAPGMDAYDAL